MLKNQKIKFLYIAMLGLFIGSVLTSGAFVAPVVFNANKYLGQELLSRFQSGLIMTEIFRRQNYLIAAISLLVFAVETGNFLKQRSKIQIVKTSLGLILLVATAMLVFYCTPAILEAQKLGAEVTASADFAQLHKLSESLFRLLLVSAVLLIVL